MTGRREQRGDDCSLPLLIHAEGKGQQMKLVRVRFKAEAILRPGISSPRGSEDAEPGQVLGREVHRGYSTDSSRLRGSF